MEILLHSPEVVNVSYQEEAYKIALKVIKDIGWINPETIEDKLVKDLNIMVRGEYAVKFSDYDIIIWDLCSELIAKIILKLLVNKKIMIAIGSLVRNNARKKHSDPAFRKSANAYKKYVYPRWLDASYDIPYWEHYTIDELNNWNEPFDKKIKINYLFDNKFYTRKPLYVEMVKCDSKIKVTSI